MLHVFLSYSRRQRSYARELARHLDEQGVPVWMDDEILTGERWEHVIRTRIDTCAAVVVVMSPDAEASAWVTRELARAESRGKPVFPVLHDGEVFFRLADVHYEDVRGGRLPGERFTAALRALTNAPPPTPAVPIPPAPIPPTPTPAAPILAPPPAGKPGARLRRLVPALVAAAVLVPVGISAADWLTPDDTGAAPSGGSTTSTTSTTAASTATSTTTAPPTTTSTPTTGATTTSQRRHTVRVYNNTTIADLNAAVVDDVRELGWTVTESGNYSQGLIPTSTVYFHPDLDEEAEARALAAALGMRAEPGFEGIRSAPAGLIVIIARDYRAPA
ncbi:TIR domain-containing protein [Saccharothrix sp. Mg75]|uniref:TIR domain-containing protein n=1 Tax=Saccharothrix sp. Mg75 TaxID=3445357 RepID=UPI003EEF352C